MNEEESVCPWDSAAADCWETETTRVKFVMKRRVIDHFITKPGQKYYFRGGFADAYVDENGEFEEETRVIDHIRLCHFLSPVCQ